MFTVNKAFFNSCIQGIEILFEKPCTVNFNGKFGSYFEFLIESIFLYVMNWPSVGEFLLNNKNSVFIKPGSTGK